MHKLQLNEFIATAQHKQEVAENWDLTDGYEEVVFFSGDIYVHRYTTSPTKWNVLLANTEETFNTLDEAATYLYTNWYLGEVHPLTEYEECCHSLVKAKKNDEETIFF